MHPSYLSCDLSYPVDVCDLPYPIAVGTHPTYRRVLMPPPIAMCVSYHLSPCAARPSPITVREPPPSPCATEVYRQQPPSHDLPVTAADYLRLSFIPLPLPQLQPPIAAPKIQPTSPRFFGAPPSSPPVAGYPHPPQSQSPTIIAALFLSHQ
ncbi:hypothetical protein AMTRI_Chr04g184520 [Amborella trichopoda]